MSVADAEQAALAELLASPFFPNQAEANRHLDRVRAAPDGFKDTAGAVGNFARRLIARDEQPIDPFGGGGGGGDGPAQAPPIPGRTVSQALKVDVAMIKEHDHFREGSMSRQQVYARAPSEHYFSHLHIDHTMSGFTAGSKEEGAVRQIYKVMMYSSKPFPCMELPETEGGPPAGARGPFYTAREHDHTPPLAPGAHKEVLIYGATQLSKTPEACFTAWCATFIDGCLAVLGVRNKGGRTQGSTDMWKGFNDVNKRIKEVFEREVQKGNIDLPASDYKKFQIKARKSSDGEYLEFDPDTRLLREPQVFIICMNAGQIKNMIGTQAARGYSKAGALAGYITIMTGETQHPYPPKCNDPYALLDDGVNRPVARMYFILDEDDLNRSNTGNVTQNLQFEAPASLRKQLDSGLAKMKIAGVRRAAAESRAAAAAASSAAAGGPSNGGAIDEEEEEEEEEDEEDEVEQVDDGVAAASEALGVARDGIEFLSELSDSRIQVGTNTTGVRSAVRGVVALTATPAACGHDLGSGASQVIHQVCKMEHPANYVGYEFTAAPYAQHTIKHEPVPDRKQIKQMKKGLFYEKVLKTNDWWNNDLDEPMMPFSMNRNGTITVRKAELDSIQEGNNKSSQDIFDIVDRAHGQAGRRGDKVLESDGVGIALMLESMAEKPLAEEQRQGYVEDERRALIISNFTRTDEQKLKLARLILMGELLLPDEVKLPAKCYEDLFVIVYHHDRVKIMWRGVSADADPDVYEAPAHDPHEVLNAIRRGSQDLFNACPLADARKGTAANFEEDGELKYFDTRHCDITEVYTALHLYARTKRMHGGRPFKLKTVVLSGELGGRGVAYKTAELVAHGQSSEPLVPKHHGYLTDMFYMFDAVKNRQITQHGEQSLQNLGRLCGLTTNEFLSKMTDDKTPPRLWTSHSCYNVIKIFGLCVDQWVQVMQVKAADESMKDAVIRCIKAEPERFAVLHMVYAKPTTDKRWAKKDLWLRQSRLQKKEKQTTEGVLAAPAMPIVARGRDFGIGHDPDVDAAAAIDAAVAASEQQLGLGDGRPRQRQRVHDPQRIELQDWLRRLETMLRGDDVKHTVSDKSRNDYWKFIYNSIRNKWIKSAAEIGAEIQSESYSGKLEQAIRVSNAASGIPLPKNPKKTAVDTVSAIRYVISHGVHPEGGGSYVAPARGRRPAAAAAAAGGDVAMA